MVLLLAAFDLIYKPGDMIISGGCEKGGDNFAEYIAKSRGISILIHYPRPLAGDDAWAGDPFYERNTCVAEDVDILLALVHPDRKGGTEDTVKKALYLDRIVYIVVDSESLESLKV